MRVDKLASKLESELPIIIKKIAKQYNVSPYIDNPNFLEERNMKWHQFGLLTHTRLVRKAFLKELNPILNAYGLYEKIKKVLNEKIDGVLRRDLLEISIPLHDLGKIPCFYNQVKYRGHALLSKKLLSDKFLKEKLTYFGLSKIHLDYIRECIGTHSFLSQEIRDKIPEKDYFGLNSISKRKLDTPCNDLAKKNKKIKVEMGVFFLCDSLAKTDIKIPKNDNNKIDESKIEQILEQRNLPKYLKNAVIQLPANIKLSEIYLENIFK